MILNRSSHIVLVTASALVCLLSHSYRANAQIRFGAAAGLNYTSIDDVRGAVNNADARTAYDNHTGWHVGVFLDMAAGFIAIRPGLYYVDSGPLFEGGFPTGNEFSQSFEDEIDSVTDDFNIVNIAIPVDVRLRLNLPIIKPYVFGGPEFRVLEQGNISTDFARNLKNFSYGLNVGVGAEVNLLGFHVMPEFRYAIDAAGITEDEITLQGLTFIPNEDHTARSVSLRLGILF